MFAADTDRHRKQSSLIDHINIAVAAARSVSTVSARARWRAGFHRVAETPEF